uniref:Uncharacterized protein n=1 Tax=viral metagenome TaxID=1070528 RepID=A0A6C0HJY6_9ZZZZ
MCYTNYKTEGGGRKKYKSYIKKFIKKNNIFFSLHFLEILLQKKYNHPSTLL